MDAAIFAQVLSSGADIAQFAIVLLLYGHHKDITELRRVVGINR